MNSEDCDVIYALLKIIDNKHITDMLKEKAVVKINEILMKEDHNDGCIPDDNCY